MSILRQYLQQLEEAYGSFGEAYGADQHAHTSTSRAEASKRQHHH